MTKILKKQPKSLLRRIQPDRKVKKIFTKVVDSRKFDMINEWNSNYGLTGANLTRWIFSYLDFSSLLQGRLVCKSWRQFLTNDRILWLKMVMKTKPFLENFFNKLTYKKTNPSPYFKLMNRYFVNNYFECIKKKHSLNSKHLFKVFGRIVSLIFVVENQANLEFHFIGEKLSEEIETKRKAEFFCKALEKTYNSVRIQRVDIKYLNELAKILGRQQEYQSRMSVIDNNLVKIMHDISEFLKQVLWAKIDI